LFKATHDVENVILLTRSMPSCFCSIFHSGYLMYWWWFWLKI